MKEKLSLFFKVTAISLIAGVAFFAVGYSYLTVSQKEPVTDNNVSSVPYYSVPENVGIMVNVASFYTFYYLDFEEEELSVIYTDESYFNEDNIYGYNIDFKVESSMELLIYFIDKFGGIDIEFEEETLNCTGVQVVQYLNFNSEIFPAIIEKIIEKTTEYGISTEDFLFMIENSKTEISIPDCYHWVKYIPEICNNVRYVN